MKKSVCIAVSCLFAPAWAMAHPGHDLSSGMMSGLLHPLDGIDHLVAMLVAGCCAAQFSKAQCWAVPAGFALVMLLGIGLGYSQVSLGHVEPKIAAAVIMLTLLMMGSVSFALSISVLLITCMGLLLGYEYGTEFPHQSGGVSYLTGFALSTAILYVTGYRLAKLLMKAINMRRSCLPYPASPQ